MDTNNTSNELDPETEVTNYLKEGLMVGELLGLIGNNRALKYFRLVTPRELFEIRKILKLRWLCMPL